MRIGEVAARIGIPTETIRFYEHRGLLPTPRRSANGYRRYDDAALARLRFVRAAQTAGLTLAEIRGIVELRDDGTTPCAHVTELLNDKIADVRERRAHLDELESEITALIDRGRHLDPADCSASEVCHILAGER